MEWTPGHFFKQNILSSGHEHIFICSLSFNKWFQFGRNNEKVHSRSVVLSKSTSHFLPGVLIHLFSICLQLVFNLPSARLWRAFCESHSHHFPLLLFKLATSGNYKWGEGSKNYLRHQKKNIPLESLVFYGPCHSLETKPSISVVFASFWKWNLSPVRFLHDIGPRNRAFAGFDAAVSIAPATLWSSNFWFSMIALKLTLV